MEAHLGDGPPEGIFRGVRDQGLELVSDHGSQPTSVSFTRDRATLEIEQILTPYDSPKDNADTGRMMQEKVIWLKEFSPLEEAKEKIGHWIEVDYNSSTFTRSRVRGV